MTRQTKERLLRFLIYLIVGFVAAILYRYLKKY
jgi:hypothetical protein